MAHIHANHTVQNDLASARAEVVVFNPITTAESMRNKIIIKHTITQNFVKEEFIVKTATV